MGKDHIWAKTIYGIQRSGTGKPDPKTIGFNTVGTGKPDPKTIYGQSPYMGFNTVWDKETGPKDHRIQHSWDRETRPKDHIWAKTIYGRRPYMGKDHIWDSTQWKPDPKTIGFNTVGTGKPDPKTIYGQRPYMGFNTVWDKETRPKDHRIQHSWDRETRPKDHIWAKTIYGIQRSGTGKPDPKTIGFNTVGTEKPDPKTIYGQRPYMGEDHIWAKTIWDSTQWDRETGSKDHRIQHS